MAAVGGGVRVGQSVMDKEGSAVPKAILTGPRLLEIVVVLDEHAPLEVADERLEQPRAEAGRAQVLPL